MSIVGLCMILSLIAVDFVMFAICLGFILLMILHSVPGAMDETRISMNIDEDELEIPAVLKRVASKSNLLFAILVFGTASCIFAFWSGHTNTGMLYVPGLIVIGGLLIAAGRTKQ